MPGTEDKSKQRRIVCTILLIVSLLITLIAGYWLRVVAVIFAELEMADLLPVVVALGLNVAFFLHPWKWIAAVLGCSLLVVAIRKGPLDRFLIVINVLSSTWTVLMALSVTSATISVIQLQRALSD